MAVGSTEEKLEWLPAGLISSWGRSGRSALFQDIPGRLRYVNPKARQRAEVLAKTGSRLMHAMLSPDERWVVFTVLSAGTTQIMLSRFRGSQPIEEPDWLPMTEGSYRDSHGRWGPTGNEIYFLSDRDGIAVFGNMGERRGNIWMAEWDRP